MKKESPFLFKVLSHKEPRSFYWRGWSQYSVCSTGKCLRGKSQQQQNKAEYRITVMLCRRKTFLNISPQNNLGDTMCIY